MANKIEKEEPIKITCNHCGKSLGHRAFYSTKNDKYKAIGFVPFCKTCIKESFKDSVSRTRNIKASIISTCMRFDIPFDDRNLGSGYVEPKEDEFSKELLEESLKVFGEFMKMTNSVGAKLLTKDSFDYEGWVNKVLIQEEKDSLTDEEIRFITKEEANFEVTPELINFFGTGYKRSEYKSLLKHYLDLTKTFECDDSVKENLFKNIANVDMNIEEAQREKASPTDLKKLVDLRATLLKNAGVELNKKAEENEKIMGVGERIKKMEQTRPDITDLVDWEDNELDKLSKIIAGWLMKGEGEVNEITKACDEVLEPYSVDIDKILGEEVGDEDVEQSEQ